ncbi:MAG: polyprenyl diphosphate synthase, partial [Gemmatimonadota bacterium]
MSDLLDRLRLAGDVPTHVAIIMDGNGRWAGERGLPRHLGHREGMKAVRETISGAVEAGVEILTMFAFSTENWNRPAQEVSALMRLLQYYARRESAELRRQGVEVHVLGELDRIDDATRGAVDQIVANTRGGTELRLNLMISYGGREELIRSARLLAERVRNGEISPEEIDEDVLEDTLFTRDVPPPDLLIRTSGEYRISNF